MSAFTHPLSSAPFDYSAGAFNVSFLSLQKSIVTGSIDDPSSNFAETVTVNLVYVGMGNPTAGTGLGGGDGEMLRDAEVEEVFFERHGENS